MKEATKEGSVSLEGLMLLVRELQQQVLESRIELRDMAREAVIASKPTLNRDEAAAYMGVSKSAVNRYCKDKILTYHIGKGGGMSYFDKEELDRFMHATKISRNEEVSRFAQERLLDMHDRRTEPRSFLSANA